MMQRGGGRTCCRVEAPLEVRRQRGLHVVQKALQHVRGTLDGGTRHLPPRCHRHHRFRGQGTATKGRKGVQLGVVERCLCTAVGAHPASRRHRGSDRFFPSVTEPMNGCDGRVHGHTGRCTAAGAQRHRGRERPFPSVSGHINGTTLLPFTRLHDVKGPRAHGGGQERGVHHGALPRRGLWWFLEAVQDAGHPPGLDCKCKCKKTSIRLLKHNQ